MTLEGDLGSVIEQYHLALGVLMKGDPEPAERLYSQRST